MDRSHKERNMHMCKSVKLSENEIENLKSFHGKVMCNVSRRNPRRCRISSYGARVSFC